jgi:hypothetical protein
MLKTDHPPIAAELLDDQGQLATPMFTVPTQVPVAVPAGEYQARLSAAGRLSQIYRLAIPRGVFPIETALNLDDQLLGPGSDGSVALAVQRDYAVVKRGTQSDILLLENQGIRYPGWLVPGRAWTLPLDKPAENPALRDAPRLRWPWHDDVAASDMAHAYYRPLLLADAPDLNGDGLEDIVIAARHQAWVMAVSAENGSVLWIAARGANVKPEPMPSYAAYSNRTPSAVLEAPIVVTDVDQDGTPDLLATFVDEGQQPGRPDLARWMECLSGKTGHSLWRFDLDHAWFQLPHGVEVPEACHLTAARESPESPESRSTLSAMPIADDRSSADPLLRAVGRRGHLDHGTPRR